MSYAIGIKATLFAYETTILITVTDSQDLLFNMNKIMEINCSDFIKTDRS
jgi:hypothetical protein